MIDTSTRDCGISIRQIHPGIMRSLATDDIFKRIIKKRGDQQANKCFIDLHPVLVGCNEFRGNTFLIQNCEFRQCNVGAIKMAKEIIAVQNRLKLISPLQEVIIFQPDRDKTEKSP
ncbi:unnamed protein product [Prunus armeniaca]